MTEADKLVLEFAAGHDVFTLVEAYQHCQAFGALWDIIIVNRLDMYRTTTRHLIHGPDYAKQNVDLIGNVIGINLIVPERRNPILKCMLIIKNRNDISVYTKCIIQ